MGIYANWAEIYEEAGWSTLPIHPNGKGCLVPGWNKKFARNKLSPEQVQGFINQYGELGIGCVMGHLSGYVGIDFDLNDHRTPFYESMILGCLPETPLIKVGEKGWTRFYRYDPDAGASRSIVISPKCSENHMLDIIGDKKYTVMPPTLHKNGVDKYRWVGTSNAKLVKPEDVPVFTKKMLLAIKEVAKTPFPDENLAKPARKKASKENKAIKTVTLKKDSDKQKKGRHDHLFSFALGKANLISDIDELTQVVLEEDLKTHAVTETFTKGPYFAGGGDKAFNAAKKEVARWCEWKKETNPRWSPGVYGRYNDVHECENTEVSEVFLSYVEFFEKLMPQARKDIVTGVVFDRCKDTGRWQPIMDKVKTIQSFASDFKLSSKPVEIHLSRWMSSKEPELLVDIKEYDEETMGDPIAEMVSKLKLRDVPQEHAVQLFKEWCANIFKRLYTRGVHQNTMIIIKGGQGKGKDTFIAHLLGGLDSYFAEMVVSSKKKENYEVIHTLLVANIPEFDETHHARVSVLKNMITSPGAKFRPSYGRAAKYHTFATSYISSCNFDKILRDSSGNRRFMIFDISEIDWKYYHIKSEHILAQMFYLYETKFKAKDQSKNVMDAIIAGETPEKLDTLIFEEIEKVFANATALKRATRSLGPVLTHREVGGDTVKVWTDRKVIIKWTDVSEDMEKIARRYRVSIGRVNDLAKKHFYDKNDSDGRGFSMYKFYKSKQISH